MIIFIFLLSRVDVGSLFIESAKFSKAPDYSKPTGDAYINQFKQAATESIKNTIGVSVFLFVYKLGEENNAFTGKTFIVIFKA